MSIGSIPLRFKVELDTERCMNCGRCIENCSYGVFRREGDKIVVNSRNCVACHRCLAFCPRDAIDIYEKPTDYRSHPVWTREIREAVFNQAKTGKIIVAGMGNVLPYPMIFDRLVLDACQVTNPSIDPLREPMELRTYIGKKPAALSVKEHTERRHGSPDQARPEPQDRDTDHDRPHELRCDQPECPDRPCKGRHQDGDIHGDRGRRAPRVALPVPEPYHRAGCIRAVRRRHQLP